MSTLEVRMMNQDRTIVDRQLVFVKTLKAVQWFRWTTRSGRDSKNCKRATEVSRSQEVRHSWEDYPNNQYHHHLNIHHRGKDNFREKLMYVFFIFRYSVEPRREAEVKLRAVSSRGAADGPRHSPASRPRPVSHHQVLFWPFLLNYINSHQMCFTNNNKH